MAFAEITGLTLWCQLLWAVLQQDLSSSHPLAHLNMRTAAKRALLRTLPDASAEHFS